MAKKLKIHTVQLNLEDLLGGTQHMDATEFGAYVMLFICCYRSSDLSIPADDTSLARMAKCGRKQWSRVKTTVAQKFIKGDRTWTHKRVLQEAMKYQSRSSINRDNVLGNKDSTTDFVEGKPDETKVSKNNNLESTIKDSPNGESNNLHPAEMSMYFEQVWAAYPGRGKHGARGAGFKGAKEKARQKFYVLLKREKDYEQFTKSVIAGCLLYAQYLDRESWCPSKHLITWLNQECWLDDFQTDDAGRGGSMGDAIAQGFAGALRDGQGEDE